MPEFSRNAILGKLDRLKLLGTRPPATKPSRAPRDLSTPTVVRNAKQNAAFSLRASKPKDMPKPKLSIAGTGAVFEQTTAKPLPATISASAWAPLPGIDPVTIMGLTSRTCRWPVTLTENLGEQAYCGALALGGVYCQAHTRRAQPTTGAKGRLDQKFGIAPRRGAA
jgi:hypothetical protein